MKHLILFIFLATNTSFLFAQKKMKNETLPFSVQFNNNEYTGTYFGSLGKQKKQKFPQGNGTFNGNLSIAKTKTSIISDNRTFTSSDLLIHRVDVSDKKIIDFEFTTKLFLNRRNKETGGGSINFILNGNTSEYLRINIWDYKYPTYDPQTATVLEKGAYIGAKATFRNIQVTGAINGKKFGYGFKPKDIDFERLIKISITKNQEFIKIYIDEVLCGEFSLESNPIISHVGLIQDETHYIEFKGIEFSQLSFPESAAFRYEGGWANGLFDGAGAIRYNNDSGFEGTFVNGELNGQGKFYNSKSFYSGNFVNSVAEGKGTITVNDKYKYEGDVKDWTPNGIGKMWILDKSIVDGVKGNQLHPNPFIEGEFRNGKPQGKGKMTFINGDTLVGLWNGYLFNSMGKLTLENGNIYEGNFIDGKPQGKGKMTYKNGETLEGFWNNDLFTGVGNRTFNNGDKYEGEWKNGKKNGKGKIIYKDGGVLDGSFIDDKFNGNGKIILKDGGVFEGNIVMGAPSGIGTVTYPNGDKLSGSWNEYGFSGKGLRRYDKNPEYNEYNKDAEYLMEEGEWFNGKLQGKGKKVYIIPKVDNDSYDAVATYFGEFKNGLFDGKGTLQYTLGSVQVSIDASWLSGQSTNGKVIYTEWGGDEDKYESYYIGELKGIGEQSGTSGTIKDADGSIYVGDIKNGMPNGKGTKTFPNGTKEIGDFVDGEYKKPFQCKTATIGNQVWMAENLKITTFRNGDPIPEAKTAREWEIAGENRQAVFCYVNNDPSTVSKYGILYNWYALNDKRGLAPEGWRIPSENDFKTLKFFSENELNTIRKQIDDLDRQGVSSQELKQKLSTMTKSIKTKENNTTMSPYWGGTKLKSKSGWNVNKFYSWNGNGTDIYGFNAKSSFERGYYGDFHTFNNANFWTSNSKLEDRGYVGVAIILKDGFGDASGDNFVFETFDFGEGYNIRCIKQ